MVCRETPNRSLELSDADSTLRVDEPDDGQTAFARERVVLGVRRGRRGASAMRAEPMTHAIHPIDLVAEPDLAGPVVVARR